MRRSAPARAVPPLTATIILVFALAPSFLGCSDQSSQPPGSDLPGPSPGSLRAIMQGMDSAASDITSGMWLEDYQRIRAGAVAIADHPQIPLADRQIIQGELADEFAAFVGFDRQVHDLAVQVRDLASERAAIADVLAGFQQLQAGCVGCHSAFRARVAAALASAGG